MNWIRIRFGSIFSLFFFHLCRKWSNATKVKAKRRDAWSKTKSMRRRKSPSSRMRKRTWWNDSKRWSIQASRKCPSKLWSRYLILSSRRNWPMFLENKGDNEPSKSARTSCTRKKNAVTTLEPKWSKVDACWFKSNQTLNTCPTKFITWKL